jgi:hypothetical protein
MEAKPLVPNSSNARNMAPGKETIQRLQVAWFNRKERRIETLVDARLYMGRSASASRVYCSVWIRSEGRHWSGHGSASGCGYHKESAALDGAIRSAGWELDTDIGGAGCSAMDEALLAIGRALKGPRAVLGVL